VDAKGVYGCSLRNRLIHSLVVVRKVDLGKLVQFYSRGMDNLGVFSHTICFPPLIRLSAGFVFAFLEVSSVR